MTVIKMPKQSNGTVQNLKVLNKPLFSRAVNTTIIIMIWIGIKAKFLNNLLQKIAWKLALKRIDISHELSSKLIGIIIINWDSITENTFIFFWYKNSPLINPPKKAPIRNAIWNVPEPKTVKQITFDIISRIPAHTGP